MSGLESFRKRHEIMFNDGCGEAVNVCEEIVAHFFFLCFADRASQYVLSN